MLTELTLKNDIGEIQYLNDRICELGQENRLSQETIFDLRLAAEEVVSNIIRYGYRDREEHQIRVQIAFDLDALTVEIRDNGKPFNPLQHPEPDLGIPTEDRDPGGLGIFLVRQVMDQVEYVREQGSNVLIMKKSIGNADESESSK